MRDVRRKEEPTKVILSYGGRIEKVPAVSMGISSLRKSSRLASRS
jgi:hypothetical protein